MNLERKLGGVPRVEEQENALQQAYEACSYTNPDAR